MVLKCDALRCWTNSGSSSAGWETTSESWQTSLVRKHDVFVELLGGSCEHGVDEPFGIPVLQQSNGRSGQSGNGAEKHGVNEPW